MNEKDLIDAICRIIEPSLFDKPEPDLITPEQVAFRRVREQNKWAVWHKAVKIAALAKNTDFQ